VIGLNNGTKLLQEQLKGSKEYIADATFGSSTDTYDRYGHVVENGPTNHLNRKVIEESLQQFIGNQNQMPPMYVKNNNNNNNNTIILQCYE